MIPTFLAMVAAQAAVPPSVIDGVALFQQVCIEGSPLSTPTEGSVLPFAALPPPARALLAGLDNRYETLDADGGRLQAVALPGGSAFLVTPVPDAMAGQGRMSSCIVLWTGGDFGAARAFRPPFSAHVALQKAEDDGWFLLRAIPSDPVAAPPG
jgi:hypothetical protein